MEKRKGSEAEERTFEKMAFPQALPALLLSDMKQGDSTTQQGGALPSVKRVI